MIKKLVILTGLLLVSLFIQLFQLNIRVSFGQSMVYSPLHVKPDNQNSTITPATLTYQATELKQVNLQQDTEIQLLKEKIDKLDDPYPLLPLERYFYEAYFDCSA